MGSRQISLLKCGELDWVHTDRGTGPLPGCVSAAGGLPLLSPARVSSVAHPAWTPKYRAETSLRPCQADASSLVVAQGPALPARRPAHPRAPPGPQDPGQRAGPPRQAGRVHHPRQLHLRCRVPVPCAGRRRRACGPAGLPRRPQVPCSLLVGLLGSDCCGTRPAPFLAAQPSAPRALSRISCCLASTQWQALTLC